MYRYYGNSLVGWIVGGILAVRASVSIALEAMDGASVAIWNGGQNAYVFSVATWGSIVSTLHWVALVMIPVGLLAIFVGVVRDTVQSAWALAGAITLAWVGWQMSERVARVAALWDRFNEPHGFVLGTQNWAYLAGIMQLLTFGLIMIGVIATVVAVVRGIFIGIRNLRSSARRGANLIGVFWADSAQNGRQFLLGAKAFARRVRRQPAPKKEDVQV